MLRPSSLRSFTAAVAAVVIFPIAAAAQSGPSDSTAAPALFDAVTATADAAPPALRPAPELTLKRPAALPALYVSFAALQVLDVTSTYTAINRGAVEANPAMKGIVAKPGALLAAKIGVAGATVFLSERIWKKNRTAAVVTMVCLNSAYAMLVAHNYRVANSLK